MDYKAVHRYADTGPRKIRLFADLIRGRNVDDALELLRFYHNRGARLVEEVVRSALGNADHLECPDLDSLVISEARVDGGPTFKRMQPRARGTAFMIKRRLAHIHVTLSDPAEEAESPTLPLPPPAPTSPPQAPPEPAATT
jgi:large subunit ribosomal protein L22